MQSEGLRSRWLWFLWIVFFVACQQTPNSLNTTPSKLADAPVLLMPGPLNPPNSMSPQKQAHRESFSIKATTPSQMCIPNSGVGQGYLSSTVSANVNNIDFSGNEAFSPDPIFTPANGQADFSWYIDNRSLYISNLSVHAFSGPWGYHATLAQNGTPLIIPNVGEIQEGVTYTAPLLNSSFYEYGQSSSNLYRLSGSAKITFSNQQVKVQISGSGSLVLPSGFGHASGSATVTGEIVFGAPQKPCDQISLNVQPALLGTSIRNSPETALITTDPNNPSREWELSIAPLNNTSCEGSTLFKTGTNLDTLHWPALGATTLESGKYKVFLHYKDSNEIISEEIEIDHLVKIAAETVLTGPLGPDSPDIQEQVQLNIKAQGCPSWTVTIDGQDELGNACSWSASGNQTDRTLTWDQTCNNGQPMASGTYTAKLVSGNKTDSVQVVVGPKACKLTEYRVYANNQPTVCRACPPPFNRQGVHEATCFCPSGTAFDNASGQCVGGGPTPPPTPTPRPTLKPTSPPPPKPPDLNPIPGGVKCDTANGGSYSLEKALDIDRNGPDLTLVLRQNKGNSWWLNMFSANENIGIHPANYGNHFWPTSQIGEATIKKMLTDDGSAFIHRKHILSLYENEKKQNTFAETVKKYKDLNNLLPFDPKNNKHPHLKFADESLIVGLDMNKFIATYETELAQGITLTKQVKITLGGGESLSLSLSFSASGKYTDPKTGQSEYLVDWSNITCIN